MVGYSTFGPSSSVGISGSSTLVFTERSHTRRIFLINPRTPGNPNLFKSLTIRQAQEGKKALSKPIEQSNDTDQVRHFNYDIAKIL
jgi:hypothetical protein